MPRHRTQSGQAMILVAVALLALAGSAALVLLAGSAASQRNQLQSMADTAALDSALKIGIGCSGAGATTVITEADNFMATQRTRTGALAIAAGTCATPYHGTDTFAGGLNADYYYPYRGHQGQVEVLLTLTLPISFSGVVGSPGTTTLTRYAVAQSASASVPAITATTLNCTGGQVNAVGDVTVSNGIVLSGGCALYAHQNPTSGAYSDFGNVRVYTDGQAWTGAGGTCAAGANSGSSNAICADGSELSGHAAPACAAATTEYLSAANQAINANPCAAGAGLPPVPPLSSGLPPDPNADPAAIATLQGTGGAACTSGGAYPTIIAGGITWGTGQAPAPVKDANGFWHFKPSCYGYLDFANAAGGGITPKQIGAESARQGHFITATLAAASTAGTLLVATVSADDTPVKATAPAGWISAVDVDTSPDRRVEIWYYPSNPGGISSVTFTMNPATINGEVQLSEWSGAAAVAPLDQTGTFASSVASTSSTTSTTGALAQAGELVVTDIGFTNPGGQTYTRGAGWNALTADSANGFGSEYRLDLPAAIAGETVTTGKPTTWANVIASFKPAAAAGGGAVLDPGFYYFNGSGFGAGGGGLCLNGGTLLARDVTLEFVNQAGLSSGSCVLGGGVGCVIGTCRFGSDPAGAPADTSYSWFSAPCSQSPSASPPDVSCLGASSWCPAGDRSCWNLLVYTPAAGSSGQLALKGASANQWLLGSMYWAGTCAVAINGDSTLAGSLSCGTLSISAGAGAGTAVGGDYGVSTATVEASLIE